jgi:hypothetical protein
MRQVWLDSPAVNYSQFCLANRILNGICIKLSTRKAMLAACAEALAEVNGESTILLISRCLVTLRPADERFGV